MMGFMAGEVLYIIPPSQHLLLPGEGGNKEKINQVSISKPLMLL